MNGAEIITLDPPDVPTPVSPLLPIPMAPPGVKMIKRVASMESVTTVVGSNGTAVISVKKREVIDTDLELNSPPKRTKVEPESPSQQTPSSPFISLETTNSVEITPGTELIHAGESPSESDSEQELQEDYSGETDDFSAIPSQDVVMEPPKPDRFPFMETESQLQKISQRVLYKIFDFLEVSDIIRASVVSVSFYKELDEDEFWCGRFITDLGEEKYKHALFLHNRNGWSTKQYLLWSLISLVGNNLPDPSERFDLLRDVWVCIMRERKRKALKMLKEKEEKEEKENKLKPTDGASLSSSSSSSSSSSVSSQNSLSAISSIPTSLYSSLPPPSSSLVPSSLTTLYSGLPPPSSIEDGNLIYSGLDEESLGKTGEELSKKQKRRVHIRKTGRRQLKHITDREISAKHTL